LLVLLKVKVRFQLLEHLKVSKEILMVKHFRLEGIFVSTLGLDENMVREYICIQEKQDVERQQL